MYTLFISTFSELITIGLLKDGKEIDRLEQVSSRNHSIYTIPMIEELLDKNEIKTNYLNEIIVVNGPGSFTGVRIGVTIAKTLAYTLDITIKTITSLQAYAVSYTSDKNKLVAIPDLKGKYIGYFTKDNDLLSNYIYLNNKEYDKYIEDKKEYLIENDSFNLNDIYNYLKNKEGINPHLVNPIYIKGIDALNDK